MSTWKGLKKSVEKFFDPNLDLQVHGTAYRPERTASEFTDLRYWITLNNKIIWDFPSHFLAWKHPEKPHTVKYMTPFEGRPRIADILRFYTNIPRKDLLTAHHPADTWGLTDILRAADRRIGARRLEEWSKTLPPDSPARKIALVRLRASYSPNLTFIESLSSSCYESYEIYDLFRTFYNEWRAAQQSGQDPRPLHVAVGCAKEDVADIDSTDFNEVALLAKNAPQSPSVAWNNISQSLYPLFYRPENRDEDILLIKKNLVVLLRAMNCPEDLLDLESLNQNAFYSRIKLTEPYLIKIIGPDRYQRLLDAIEALLGVAKVPTHEVLMKSCKMLLEDYVPYGKTARKDANDCSSGCRFFLCLPEPFQADWGVCLNPQSHREGLLTFEHQGCRNFSRKPTEDDES